jgi:hypothetical protein
LPTRTLVRLLVPLVAAAIAGLAPAAAHAVDCGPIMAVDDVAAGMTGTGWTVAQGRTRVPFDVEILGVAHDGIAPGRDLIIVEVSSPEIDAAGGIWAGMSGSPVYVGADLLGSVSYGFSFGPSKIGGVTPAEDMVDLLGLPSVTSTVARATPRSVRLNGALARTVAARTGASLEQASALKQLRVPLSMSGLGTQAMKVLLANFKNRQSDGFIPYAGASADRHAAAVGDPLEAGDNFASVVSYGDVTAAAVGTATYVCNGQALAFGHPFLFGGPVVNGANAADAFAIVPDPVNGPFKFAEIAETLGVVDQDRLAGLRATLGGAPAAIPIRTEVNVPELGVHRQGLTEVVVNDWAGYLTFAALLAAIDSAFDASGTGTDFAGRGTASVWWTFEGTRSDGSPWRLSRGNRYVSKVGISPPAAINPGFMLDSLIFNPTEQIKVTSANVSLTVEKAVRLYTIKDVLVAVGSGRFHARSHVAVRRGTKLRVRVVLRKFEGGTKNMDYTFRLPKNRPPGGSIVFFGSVPFFEEQCYAGFCFVGGDFFEPPDDFGDLVEAYQQAPRNDVLNGTLLLGRRFSGARKSRLDGVVVGFRGVRLLSDGSAGGTFGYFRAEKAL